MIHLDRDVLDFGHAQFPFESPKGLGQASFKGNCYAVAHL
jgi:hypothetical protein